MDDGGVYIEEALQEVLHETDLVNFQRKLCVELQLSRLEHFEHISDEELRSCAGLSQPAVRRLRQAITEKKKKLKKSRGLFSTIGRKDQREVSKVLLKNADDNLVLHRPEKNATSLIGKEEIKLLDRLGEGSFAVVKRAFWTPAGRAERLDVAVKILRDATPEVIDDLQHEVNNMQKLLHPNLIQLYGIVFSTPPMMVVEYCNGGSLVDRLRSNQKPVLLVSMLLDYAHQIAKGMAYLESKHCVHRDLAARNVLLTENEKVAKICDFGLMRLLGDNERLYVMSAQKKVPFAWCPPESLRYRQFSHASDVWAFGVTLWELFSYGEEPWIGLRGAEVLIKLENGDRLQRPQRCSDELYDLMKTCWSLQAETRPRFSLLKGILNDIKFMIAECREPNVPLNSTDLELSPNENVLVINTSGMTWFGQSLKTHKFGCFLRTSVNLRSDRNAMTVSLSPVKSMSADHVSAISKPIVGSFIHAGHGDINPDQCWGQPDRIDDIYLKNPILRNENDCNNKKPAISFPQIIPSLTNASCLENNRCQEGSATQQYSIDPFGPFSEYGFDGYEDSTAIISNVQPAAENGVANELPANFYDQPPLNAYSTMNVSVKRTLPKPLQLPSIPPSSSHMTRATASGTDIVQAKHITLSKQSLSASQLPDQPNVIGRNNVYSSAISKGADSAAVQQYSGLNSGADQFATSVQSQKRIPSNGANAVYSIPPSTNQPINAPLLTNFSTTTKINDVSDPFEKVSPPSASIQQSPLIATVSSISSTSQNESISTSTNTFSGSSRYTSQNYFTTPYYWHPGYFTNQQRANHSSHFPPFGSTPALLYDTKMGNLARPSSAGISTASLTPIKIHGVSTDNSKQRNSYISDEILGMFDPLVSDRKNVAAVGAINKTSQNRPQALETVIRKAAFASHERCENMLVRCGNNPEKATCELKIDELLSMGVAKDRNSAVSALEDCRWDLNDAASALIS